MTCCDFERPCGGAVLGRWWKCWVDQGRINKRPLLDNAEISSSKIPKPRLGILLKPTRAANRGQTIACGAPRRDEERYQHGSSGWGWKAWGCLPRRDSEAREEQGEQEEPYGKGQVKKNNSSSSQLKMERCFGWRACRHPFEVWKADCSREEACGFFGRRQAVLPGVGVPPFFCFCVVFTYLST